MGGGIDSMTILFGLFLCVSNIMFESDIFFLSFPFVFNFAIDNDNGQFLSIRSEIIKEIKFHVQNAGIIAINSIKHDNKSRK